MKSINIQKLKNRVNGIIISRIKFRLFLILIPFLFILLFFTYFFMFYFFPYNSLKNKIESYAINNMGINLKINSIYPSLPFNVNLKGTRLGSESGKPMAKSSIITIDASPFVLYNMLIFKKIPVNIDIYNTGIYSLNSGFLKIPAFNLKFINIKAIYLYKENKERQGGSITGNANYTGDLNGTIADISVLYLHDKIIKIIHAIVKIKPKKSVIQKFIPLFSTIFKKNKKGYYIYDISDLFI